MKTSSLLGSMGVRRGFTLLEMVITMAIFLLLAGAVFGIITGVLQGASTLRTNQNRRDEVDAFNNFLRNKLASMTAQSAFSSYNREGESVSGIIVSENNKAWALDAKVQPNGYYNLRFAEFSNQNQSGIASSQLVASFRDLITNNDSTLKWVPLLGDLKTVEWKFQPLDVSNWTDAWLDGSLPNLVELTFQQAGERKPVAMDFWLPHIVPPGAQQLIHLSSQSQPQLAPPNPSTPVHGP